MSTDSAQRYYDEGHEKGIAWILREFIGATSVFSWDPTEKSIQVRFVALNQDETAREERLYILRASNSPEENMRILLEARKRQAWFQRHSDEVDVSDIDPNAPQEEDEAVGVATFANSRVEAMS